VHRWINALVWCSYAVHSSLCIIVPTVACGVVVSLLATGPKGWGFEPNQGDGFLKAIKSLQHTLRMGSQAGGPMS
jgi:hypothetical protein